MTTSLIVAAYNEAETLPEVILNSERYVDEIIVIDDASTDNTEEVLQKFDIVYLKNSLNLDQEKSIERGIQASRNEILITMDGDVEHNPHDIPRLLQELQEQDFDIVIGKRNFIPRKSEKEVSRYTTRKWGLKDPFCGFRVFYRYVYETIGSFHINNYYGIDFAIRAAQQFNLGTIDLTTMPRRTNARIGNDKSVDKKINDIFKYIKRAYN